MVATGRNIKKIHIGIASPVSTAQLSDYLILNGREPEGTEGATAPNLLVIELLKRGFNVSVFSLSKDIKEKHRISGKNLTIHYLPRRQRARHFALDFFRKERDYLKKTIQEVNPDIVHAHWQYEYAWASIDSGIKTIVTCRDSPVKVLLLYKNAYRFIRLIMAYIVLKKAVYVTATSAYLADELKKFGVKKQIAVVPNFEPEWLFEIPIQKEKDLQNPRIMMINNGFGDLKNVSKAIEAFALFRRSYPNAELHLYGHGYEESGMAFQWAERRNLNTNVLYRGYKDFVNLMHELSSFTMLVHPSKEEAFGNILAESMALGVPVIGGKHSGSVPWVIGPEQKGGILVDINDEADIALGMNKIIANEEVYNSFAEGARTHVKEHFSAKKVVDKYLSIYKGLEA